MNHEQPTFGPELRRRRLAANLTLTHLASLVHYSKSHLSKVERNLKAPSRELARLCDSALHAHGKLASLTDEKDAPEEPSQTRPDEVIWLMRLPENGESQVQSTTRRQLMIAGLLAFPVTSATARQSSGRAADPAIPGIFRTIFDHYRHLGQVSDPELLIHPLIAQNHLLQELARTAEASNRKKMLVLSSRYTEYIGWLCQEIGNDHAALWWTRQAIGLAREGGDPDFASYGLVRHALVTLYRGDAKQTTQLAQRAQSLDPPPRIFGLAALREAQGHALTADYDASMRALDRGAKLLHRPGKDGDQPIIGTSNLPDPAEMARGWCLYDLGRPRAADRVLDEQLARVPRRAVRTRARYGARRALACSAAGEIDQACHLASDVLDNVVGGARSATITKDLRTLARVLDRHPKNPSVRELAPRLSTALHFA